MRTLCWRKQCWSYYRRSYGSGEGQDHICVSSSSEWCVLPEISLRSAHILTFQLGLVNPKCTGLIGNGVVVHIPSFFVELDALQSQGNCQPYPRPDGACSDGLNRSRLYWPVVHLRPRTSCLRFPSNCGWVKGSRTWRF